MTIWIVRRDHEHSATVLVRAFVSKDRAQDFINKEDKKLGIQGGLASSSPFSLEPVELDETPEVFHVASSRKR